MPMMVKFASRREPALIRTLFFLAPLVTLIVPKTTVGVLVILSAAIVLIAVNHGQSLKELFRFDLGMALFAVVGGYLFINATWSLDPANAYGKSAWFVVVVLMTFAACRALRTWQEEQIRVAANSFLIGLAVGAAYVLLQIATDALPLRLLYNALPITRPDGTKHMVIQDGLVVEIATLEFNRHVAVMLLMLWSALLCLSQFKHKRWRAFAIVGLLLIVTASIFLSRHESSKLGLLVSALAFALALPWPTAMRRAVWIGWCLAFLLVVPLALVAFKAQLHEAEWLQLSGRARIILWAYTAEQIPKAPILGIGLTSTRKMDLNPETRLEAIKPKGYVYAWRAGSHAHNEFLQTWYELGAIGVVLFIVAGSSVILSVGRLPEPTQAYVLAQFTAFLMIAAFSWGMWQSWLMALTGLTALYAALAVNFYRIKERAPTPAADVPAPPS
jgi:O-antigen ligase